MAKLHLEGGVTFEGTPEEIKAYTDLYAEKAEPALKAGDFVTIDTDKYKAGITAEKVYVVFARTDGKLCFLDDGGVERTWPLEDGAYTIVEASKLTFKTGDIVVITVNTNDSRNAVGDIGKIGKVHPVDANVDVPWKTKGNGNRTRKNEMRHASPAEREQYEANAKQAEKDAIFTKIGRKPGEFKKGDIVRVGSNTDCTPFIGTIQIVRVHFEGLAGGNVHFEGHSDDNDDIQLGRNVELIAPVESRLDMKAGA